MIAGRQKNNFYDFDEFNLNWLKAISHVETGSLVRISRHNEGIHIITKEENPLVYSYSCAGFRYFGELRNWFILWHSDNKWIRVTKELKERLLSSRNPYLALKEIGDEINE